MALYNATGGANWKSNDNWLSEEPLSTWHGVEVDNNGRVTGLSLPNNSLSGTIPDLSGLTKLTELYLNTNSLSGSIPDLSALTDLTLLALSTNELSGTIPDLSALTDLEGLFLFNNQLSGSFPDLSALTNLTHLYLEHNQLSGTVPAQRLPIKARYLSLSQNKLSGPLPAVSLLTDLMVLSLTNNQFCLPEDLDLSGSSAEVAAHVQRLQLPSCADATATPTATVTPTATATTTATATPTATATITGTTPITGTTTIATSDKEALVALYNATNGANWTKKDNWLSEEPLSTWHGVEVDNSGRVLRLHLTFNRLSGTIPDLSALANLTDLRLQGNTLSGSIPDLSALTSLTHLMLSHNELSGTIPDLSVLTNLTHLHLSYNELSGSIPDLSALTILGQLYLDGNQLSGSISVSSLPANVRYLHLSQNKLSGPLLEVSALTSLTNLSLTGNQFCRPEDLDLSGSSADVIEHVQSLPLPACAAREALVAVYNATDGANWTKKDNWLSEEPLSTWHGVTVDNHGRVIQLALGTNGLSGTIPDLSELTNLTGLSLSDNQLSGSIPDLSDLTNLTRLSLNDNQLSGSVPDLSAFTNLTHLSLNDNQLSGSIPDLSANAKLVRLYLNNNQLNGPVFDLGFLYKLQYLVLNDNQLSGPVPDLSANAGLAHLELSDNQFCLPDDADLSDSNSVVVSHINSLNLLTCTAAEVSAVLEAPQNLAVIKGTSEVTLTWDAVTNAASYELWTWDSIEWQWAGIGGVITDTTYTHSVLTDGRNYLYQVRAQDASDQRGPWSGRVYAVLAETQFSPPPPSLGYDLFYQKYVDVDEIAVVAPSYISDEWMIRAQGIITGMLANRSDLFETLVARNTYIAIHGSGGRSYQSGPTLWWARTAPTCQLITHEFAHLVHYALSARSDSRDFDPKVRALYQAAMDASLWSGTYAATNEWEYWAEATEIHFTGGTNSGMPQELVNSSLADYDAGIAALVVEVFGDAEVPAFCRN